MDIDEVFFFGISPLLTIVGVARWYLPLLRTPLPRVRGARVARLLLGTLPIALLICLWFVLRDWADSVYVAGNHGYMLLFLLGGAGWIFCSLDLLKLAGIHARMDAIERGNHASALVVAGTFVGVFLAYAGSNIGYGPTIWTTVVPAVLSTAILLGLAALSARIGGGGEMISLDRDCAAGFRLAFLIITSGALLGRAVAGDWHGWQNLWQDGIRMGWPVIILAIIAIVFDRLCRPTPLRPRPSFLTTAAFPAAIMFAVTATFLVQFERPDVAAPAEHLSRSTRTG